MNKLNILNKKIHKKFVFIAFTLVLIIALFIWIINNINNISIPIIVTMIITEGIILYIMIYLLENATKRIIWNNFWRAELEHKCNVWSQYSWIDEREGFPLYIYWEQAEEIGFIKKHGNEAAAFGCASASHYMSVYTYEAGNVIKIKIYKAQIPSKANFVTDRTITPELWELLYDSSANMDNRYPLNKDQIMVDARKSYDRCVWHHIHRDTRLTELTEPCIQTKEEIMQYID